MGLHTYGTMAVDWEERVRFDRLREERLARISSLLAGSELGALLCFDMTNIRYITATHIGTWAQDKLNRFCLLPQGDPPIMWDFGSAARHHQLYNPWLGDGRSRAGISTLRGAMSPESGRAEDVAEKIRMELDRRGLLGETMDVLGFQIAFSTTAVVMAQTFVALPFLVVSLEGALRTAGRQYEVVAASLGAGPTTVFRRVTIPLVFPGLVSGAVLSFARSLGEFGATITFAGSLQGVTRTLPLEIYLRRETDAGAAVALSLVLVLVAIVVIGFARQGRTAL